MTLVGARQLVADGKRLTIARPSRVEVDASDLAAVIGAA